MIENFYKKFHNMTYEPQNYDPTTSKVHVIEFSLRFNPVLKKFENILSHLQFRISQFFPSSKYMKHYYSKLGDSS